MGAGKPQERTHWLVRIIIGFQIAVVIGFFSGLWLLLQDYQFSRRAIVTEAEIVDIDYSNSVSTVRGVSSGLNTFPVFAFIGPNGIPRQVRPIVAMNGRFFIGERRDILIDPANPAQRVQLLGWQFYTGMGGILLLVTGPMALLFIWGIIRQKRLKNQKRLRRNRKARERRARLKAQKQAAKED